MRSGVYCKNIAHVEMEDDGMVYCQHCYRELEAENERLRHALEIIVDDKSLSFVVQQIAKGALEE